MTQMTNQDVAAVLINRGSGRIAHRWFNTVEGKDQTQEKILISTANRFSMEYNLGLKFIGVKNIGGELVWDVEQK